MYFTCGSIATWSSDGREQDGPARPGPDTKDILGLGVIIVMLDEERMM